MTRLPGIDYAALPGVAAAGRLMTLTAKQAEAAEACGLTHAEYLIGLRETEEDRAIAAANRTLYAAVPAMVVALQAIAAGDFRCTPRQRAMASQERARAVLIEAGLLQPDPEASNPA